MASIDWGLGGPELLVGLTLNNPRAHARLSGVLTEREVLRVWERWAGRHYRDRLTGDLGYLTDAGAVQPVWW